MVKDCADCGGIMIIIRTKIRIHDDNTRNNKWYNINQNLSFFFLTIITYNVMNHM